MKSKRKRVLLVDKFAFSRSTASRWVRQTPDLAVCGEVDSDIAALYAVEQLKPDAVVTEVLSERDLAFVRALNKKHPYLPILVYSVRHEEPHAARALEAGADGYLMKGADADELLEGIRATLQGRMVLSPKIRARLLSKCVRSRRLSPPTPQSCAGKLWAWRN